MIELMVSIGIFSVLMAIMGAATISAFRTINTVTDRSDTQAKGSLAAEQVSRLLRYASRPNPSLNVIESASTTAITFYTYAGTGKNGDVPYKVSLRTITSGNIKKIVSTTCWPTTYGTVGTYNGLYWNTYPADATHCKDRTILTVPATATNPLTIQITKCDRNTDADCRATRTAIDLPVNPAVLAMTPTSWEPDTVTFTIGDTNAPEYLIKQQVGLVNAVGRVNAG